MEKPSWFIRNFILPIAKPLLRYTINYTDSKEFWHNITYGTGQMSEAGEFVDVKKGSKIDTAFSCINVLAQDISKLPFNVKKNGQKGNEIVYNSPVQRLIHTRPNKYTSAINFWHSIVWQMLSHGNAYAYIEYQSGTPSQLHLINPTEVECIIVDDEVYYEHKKKVYTQDEILHFKLYSFDGIKGVSPIIYNAQSFGYRIKIDKYTAKVLGSKPPGLLSSDQTFNTDQQKQLSEAWEKQIAGQRTPVLGGGLKYDPLMIPPSEGQMIEASEISDERIMGIYRVPPTLIQNYRRTTFNTAEQQQLVYRTALHPIIRVIEQEVDYKLLKGNQFSKFNFDAMLYADIATQDQHFKNMISYGVYSPNDVRRIKDMPVEDETGDMRVIQGAFVPLDMLREFYNKANGVGDEVSGGDDTTEQNNIQQLGFQVSQLKLDLKELQNNGKGTEIS